MRTNMVLEVEELYTYVTTNNMYSCLIEVDTDTLSTIVAYNFVFKSILYIQKYKLVSLSVSYLRHNR
jgi:hypothetical protein